MKHFCIITNSDKGANRQIAKRAVEYLQQHGGSCVVLENRLEETGGIRHFTAVKDIPEEVECAIVLGGDGTMVQAAIDLVHCDVPILGVNTGTLGFLTEVECQSLEEALERLLLDNYSTERRIMLKETEKFKGIDSRTSCYALNDMVITKQGGCRLITIKVYQGEELIDVYRADGLIVSTPTGSTGYNLSAGGPVLVPGLHATVVTPICPHSLNKRSLLLDAGNRITLEIGQTKEVGEDLAVLSADGRYVGDLKTGDRLVLEVPHATTEFIKLSGKNFYEKMRQKLNGD
ncbi:MAG: NAD(+)/NADH kinase [Lachnospiraceae bacterium]|nr:NAD(+)/NADH kinase [Lachnospiraceae bacterium]